MDNHFGGIIWTNHALSRMRQRGIKQGDAWATWRRPDSSRKSKNRGTFVYYRTFGSQQVEVVTKKNEKNEWIVLSVWSRTYNPRKKDKTKKSLIIKLINSVLGRN